MRVAYKDLIQPYFVRQVSKSRAYCMCGRTKNPPFWDQSHTATSIKPRVLEVESPTTMAICSCWKSKTRPYCDGTHGRIIMEMEKMAAEKGQ